MEVVILRTSLDALKDIRQEWMHAKERHWKKVKLKQWKKMRKIKPHMKPVRNRKWEWIWKPRVGQEVKREKVLIRMKVPKG